LIWVAFWSPGDPLGGSAWGIHRGDTARIPRGGFPGGIFQLGSLRGYPRETRAAKSCGFIPIFRGGSELAFLRIRVLIGKFRILVFLPGSSDGCSSGTFIPSTGCSSDSALLWMFGGVSVGVRVSAAIERKRLDAAPRHLRYQRESIFHT
jgi:hypothetical protein